MVLAFLVDATQWLVGWLIFIPVAGFVLVVIINTVVGMMAAGMFLIIFTHLGVSMGGAKRVLGLISTIGGETLPLMNILPLWMVYIGVTIWLERHSPQNGASPEGPQ